MDHAPPPAPVVIAVAEEARGAAGEPVTRYELRRADGATTVARLVGGGSARGGRVYLATTPTWAPGSPPGTWADASLPVSITPGSPSRDLEGELLPELALAVRAWPEVPCTRFRAAVGAPRALAPADDGVSVVWFEERAWPAELSPGVLAQTVVHTDAQGHVYDADIWVNAVDHRFSLNARPGTVDVRGVLVHELGHLLGLGHSADPVATMFPTTAGLRWRSLERDDVDGVCALYPGAGAARCPTSPCPAGHPCVAGRCQRVHDPADVCAPCARVPGACEAAGDDARCVDVGAGALRGAVCGRACATSADCGVGASCVATSAAGDLQCVADDGCAAAAWTCVGDADCPTGRCLGGACKGAAVDAADAGADSARAPDASAPPRDEPGGGGCDCAASGVRRAAGGRATLLLLALTAISSTLRRPWTWPWRRRPSPRPCRASSCRAPR